MEIDKILFGQLSARKGIDDAFEDLDVNNDDIINEKDIASATDSNIKNAIINLLDSLDEEAELEEFSTQEAEIAEGEGILTSVYNIKGLDVQVTSKSGGEPDFSYKISGNTVTITANNCTIDISSEEASKILLITKGNNLTLNCNSQIKSITNYANNSEINGSIYDDIIINRAKNVYIDANLGNDTIKTYKANTTINSTDGSIDKISSKSLNVTINTSGLYVLNNKYYFNKTLANGEIQGVYFKNGVAYTGIIKSDNSTIKRYKNGLLISSTITTVENGKTVTKTYDAENNCTKIKIKYNGKTNIIYINGGEFTENYDGTFTLIKSVKNKQGITTNTISNYDENGKVTQAQIETYDNENNLTKVRIIQNKKSKTISAGSNGELFKNDDGTFTLIKSVTNKKGVTTETITNYDETGKLTRTNVETYDSDNNLTKVKITQNKKTNTLSTDEGTLIKSGNFYILTNKDGSKKYYDDIGNEINANDMITKVTSFCKDINPNSITNVKISFNEDSCSIDLSFESDNIKWKVMYMGSSTDLSLIKYESDTKYNIYNYSNYGKLQSLEEMDDEKHLNILTFYYYADNTKMVITNFYGTLDKESIIYDLTTGEEISKSETNKEYFDYAMKLAEINSDLLDYITYPDWKSDNYNANITLSDSVKSDIDMLVTAHENALKAGEKDSNEYKEAFNQYIANSMVKDYASSNKTDEEILAEISTGDVIEKTDGIYVNDNGTLVKLNMTKDQYIEMFPPVKRYAVHQGGTGDCYFVASVLAGAMNNTATYAKLLQMINVDNKTNDITIKFTGTSDYPVTFKSGELYETDQVYQEEYRWGDKLSIGGCTGAKGLLLLEQAFALARFASEENRDITSLDIDDALSYIHSGLNSEALNFVFGNIAPEAFEFHDTYEEMENALNAYANDVNNANMILGASTKTEINMDDTLDYSIVVNHAYTIQNIDTENKIVSIINPWAGGIVVNMSYETFINNFPYLYVADLSRLV